jgi:hypothetical protein
MNSRKSRKVASMLLVAVALLGVRAASASGLGLDGDDLFVGGDLAEDCGSSSVAVDYDVAYDAALKGYGVSAAQLSGLDERCQGYEVIVTLSGPGGATLAEMTAVVNGEEVRVEVPPATPVAAEHLAGVAVVLRSAEG